LAIILKIRKRKLLQTTTANASITVATNSNFTTSIQNTLIILNVTSNILESALELNTTFADYSSRTLLNPSISNFSFSFLSVRDFKIQLFKKVQLMSFMFV